MRISAIMQRRSVSEVFAHTIEDMAEHGQPHTLITIAVRKNDKGKDYGECHYNVISKDDEKPISLGKVVKAVQASLDER